ncbi:hypothetical protein EYF80_057714 [Liparis tanakae]|uniref:Uncharacterized protein n=1 Tax=Liparis tanakae TaxID=230148 RepID=A0A4Z2ET90_9TELE|nr:hypothetical protein EYF80_057714 [Liparis tanakae]
MSNHNTDEAQQLLYEEDHNTDEAQQVLCEEVRITTQTRISSSFVRRRITTQTRLSSSFMRRRITTQTRLSSSFDNTAILITQHTSCPWTSGPGPGPGLVKTLSKRSRDKQAVDACLREHEDMRT